MKNILVLCGDYNHSAEVVIRGFHEVQVPDAELDFVVDVQNIVTPEMLEDYDMIITCKANHAMPYNKSPLFGSQGVELKVTHLIDYVSKGKALLVIHSGGAFEEGAEKEYTDFIGSHFVKHPPRCEVKIQSISKHPIMEGVKEFTVHDEHYEIALYDGYENVLFETQSESGGIQVGGYTKTLGEGKVCCLTPGHVVDVWKNEGYQKVIRNSIKWCLEE